MGASHSLIDEVHTASQLPDSGNVKRKLAALHTVQDLGRSPVASVLRWRSEPAKSTSAIFERRSVALEPAIRVCVKFSVKMECEREECSFIFVAAVIRFSFPSISRRRTSL